MEGNSEKGDLQDEMDHFGSHFSLKFDEQIDAKIDAEKVMKIDENSMQNGPEIDLKIDTFRKLVS